MTQMALSKCARFLGRLSFLIGAAATSPAQTSTDSAIDAYRQRMQAEPARHERGGPRQTPATMPATPKIEPAAGQPGGSREALLTGPISASQPSPLEVMAEIPDPSAAGASFGFRLDRTRQSREKRSVDNYRDVISLAGTYLQQLARPRKLEISLAECVQRALVNNYTIRFESYGPAITRTQLVEAEAAFDAVFFLDTSYANNDRPTGLDLPNFPANQSDIRSYSGGIRQVMPTGLQAQLAVGQSRTFNDPDPTQRLMNPAWDMNFTATLTQPLLRGFGLDYNRAGIEIARADLKISEERFVQQVRDQVFEVERQYWLLVRARRTAMILAESTAQNAVTYRTTKARETLDATAVEISNSRSRWGRSEVNFRRAVTEVKNAEDLLKNLINDSELKLSEDIEIIPIETPATSPISIDQFAEVRTALDQRPEVRQAKLQIEQARIQAARAKNETLPTLNLQFQYEVDGREVSADQSFDRFTSNDYRSYSVRLQFEVPIGQRADRARFQRAQNQETQAIVNLHRTMDLVVQEVNQAARTMVLGYESIPIQLASVLDADRNVRAFQDRTTEVSPNFLETELSATENLANSRIELLRLVTEYNIAVVALERAKGTLLQYNNIRLIDGRERR
jgi:outer membrane protein